MTNPLFNKIKDTLISMNGVNIADFADCPTIATKGGQQLGLSEIVVEFENPGCLNFFRKKASMKNIRAYLLEQVGEPVSAGERLTYHQENGQVMYTVIVRDDPVITSMAKRT